jgi:hypothetical protein
MPHTHIREVLSLGSHEAIETLDLGKQYVNGGWQALASLEGEGHSEPESTSVGDFPDIELKLTPTAVMKCPISLGCLRAENIVPGFSRKPS